MKRSVPLGNLAEIGNPEREERSDAAANRELILLGLLAWAEGPYIVVLPVKENSVWL
jgi:hypothetical protein